MGYSLDWHIWFPSYVYWYILSLFFMRLLISWCDRGELCFAIVILSMFSGICNRTIWNFLSLGRVVLLYGIFYLGYRCQFSLLNKIRTRYKYQCILLGCGALIGETLFLIMGVVDITWATHDYSVYFWDYILKYIYMFVFSIGIFALLMTVTFDIKCVKHWGKNSLIIYLIHPFAVESVRTVVKLSGISNTMVIYIVFLIASLLITEVLSLNSTRRIYDYFMIHVLKMMRID